MLPPSQRHCILPGPLEASCGTHYIPCLLIPHPHQAIVLPCDYLKPKFVLVQGSTQTRQGLYQASSTQTPRWLQVVSCHHSPLLLSPGCFCLGLGTCCPSLCQAWLTLLICSPSLAQDLHLPPEGVHRVPPLTAVCPYLYLQSP